MKRLYLTAILLIISGVTNAANQVLVTGTIKAMRTQTSHHANTDSHGEVILQMSGSLEEGCNWLSVEKENTAAVSFLLSAQAQQKEITIWYYDDVKSAAWSSACQLINIELK